MVVNHLNFVYLFEVKAKSKYRIFEFRFSIYEKHEMALWIHGLTSIFQKTKRCQTIGIFFMQRRIYRYVFKGELKKFSKTLIT